MFRRLARHSVFALALGSSLILMGHSRADAESKTQANSKEGEDVAIAAIDEFITSESIDKSASGWKTKLNQPPQVEFSDGKTYYWTMKTNVGDIKIKLLPQVAPMHVSSTIYLTRLGFYDGVVFHRVISGFMAQGGDPLGRGTGGPGYNYGGEFSDSVKHDKPGILSMANAGPGTDGTVLPHVRAHTSPRWQAHDLRRGRRRHGYRTSPRRARQPRRQAQRDPHDREGRNRRRIARRRIEAREACVPGRTQASRASS